MIDTQELTEAQGIDELENIDPDEGSEPDTEGEAQTGEPEAEASEKTSGPKRRYLTGEPTEGFGLPRAMYSVYLEENLEGDAAAFQIPDYLAALKALVGKKFEGALSVFERVEKTKEGEVKGVHIYVATPATIERLKAGKVRTSTASAKALKVNSFKQISAVLAKVLSLLTTSTEIHGQAKEAGVSAKLYAAQMACRELNFDWGSLVAKAHEFGVAEDLDLPAIETEAAA